jgi:hypothetical protein
MAGHLVARLNFDERRRPLAAYVPGERAARLETTARWRFAGARDITVENDSLPFAFDNRVSSGSAMRPPHATGRLFHLAELVDWRGTHASANGVGARGKVTARSAEQDSI